MLYNWIKFGGVHIIKTFILFKANAFGRAVVVDIIISQFKSYQFFILAKLKRSKQWAVVVAQLAEQLLLTPEICGLNQYIGEYLDR